MKFKNTINNYTEESSAPFLWCLIFGGLYFAYKGIWSHAVIGLVLAIPTVGVSWLLYPFFAKEIVRKHYLSKGWVPVR